MDQAALVILATKVLPMQTARVRSLAVTATAWRIILPLGWSQWARS